MTNNNKSQSTILPILLLSSVFFTWGILTTANSILVSALQLRFDLTYEKSMLVQLSFYLAPFIICIPTSILMVNYGYKKSIFLSILFSLIGCLSLYFSLNLNSFTFALSSIFFIAMGVAAMQVVANPYIASIGDKNGITKRLTIASAFNSTGTTLGPILLSYALASVGIPFIYLLLSFWMGIIILLFFTLNIQDHQHHVNIKIIINLRRLIKNKKFTFSAFILFMYIGAEVSIGTITINYLSSNELGGLSLQDATKYISLYWGGSFLGRIIYSLLSDYLASTKVLARGTTIAILFIILSMLTNSLVGGILLILIGLCNSVMYPIIFSKAIEGLGESTAAASAILIMCGIGGAVIPMLQATIVTNYSIPISYLIPLISYIFILIYSKVINNIS